MSFTSPLVISANVPNFKTHTDPLPAVLTTVSKRITTPRVHESQAMDAGSLAGRLLESVRTNSSMKSFLISDDRRRYPGRQYVERGARILSKFLRENWYIIKWLLLSGAVVLTVLVLIPAMA